MKMLIYIGMLKGYVPATHRAITRKLSSYLGPDHPAVSLRAPHVPSIESAATTTTSDNISFAKPLSILLLSAEDGRDSLVDLTTTLADLVDAELAESVMGEPDLLVLFSPIVELSGYPPWQVRLTEIYHVQDNQGVGYQVFLRALYNYANAQMRMGR
jgi:dehydrodolichyl diphosphate syntase complex subunit NUS1